jgi:hypothetical protein
MTSDLSHSKDAWDDDEDSYVDTAIEFDEILDYRPIDDNFEADWLGVSDDGGETPAGESDEMIDTLLVTARSPNDSITATGFMDGRIFQVTFSTQVSTMSESELADEIVKVCTMASRQADAAHHYLLATVMRELGQDPAGTRSFLERSVGLPSPETVIDEKARMFAGYYSTNDESNSSG